MAGRTQSIKSLNIKWILAAVATVVIALSMQGHPELDLGKLLGLAYLKLPNAFDASVLLFRDLAAKSLLPAVIAPVLMLMYGAPKALICFWHNAQPWPRLLATRASSW